MPSRGYGFLILPKLSDFLGEFIGKVKEILAFAGLTFTLVGLGLSFLRMQKSPY